MITLYEKSTCSKCQKVKKILDEAGVTYNEVHYYDMPLSMEKLENLLRKLSMSPHELIRTKEDIYRELDIKNKDVSDNELIALMVKHPDLIERPIVEKGERAVLGRPPENVRALL